MVTRFAGVFGVAMAEWCIGRIIEWERNFQPSHQDQLVKEWALSKQILDYRYLNEMTLTILGGTGDIGTCIAKTAKLGFGMKVVGYRNNKTAQKSGASSSSEDYPYLDEVTTDLTYALSQADYIISVMPSTDDTRGLLSSEVLQQAYDQKVKNNLQQGVDQPQPPVLINVGRGDLITTQAIIDSLSSKLLSGVILDVVEEEPLPSTNPLWTTPNVIISPHISALTRGKDVPKVIIEQYQRYTDSKRNGGDLRKDLQYVVDWDKGY